MKFKNIMLAVAASGVLAASGMALAQPPGGEWHHGGGGMEFLHGITLSDAQKAQVQQIHKAAWTQMKPIMEQMRSIHEQVANQLLAAGRVTAEQFTPMVQQEEALKSQIDSIHLNEMLQLRGVLTPEQLAQAAATHTKLEALHAQEHAVISGEATEQ
jgi:Spy/CpxP family protein refolding chaperone